MRGWTIRRKMTFWYALTIVILLCVFFIILYGTLTPAIVRGVQDRVERDVLAIGPAVRRDEAGELDMDEVVISADTLYTVYDSDGVPAFTNHSFDWFTDTPFVEGAHEMRASGQDWVLRDGAVSREGETIALVRAGAPLGASVNTASGLVLIFLAVIPIGAVVAVLIGSQIARKSLRPIDEITRTAEEIQRGDLSRRITLPPADDEVGRLASAFNGMLDSVETAFNREKRFTSDASHELRTPLAVIIGAAQTSLGDRTLPVEEYRAALRTIYKRGADMQAMLSQMLLLARGREQARLMEITTLNLSDLARDIAEEFEEIAAARRIEMRLEIQENVYVEGDLMLLTRAVMNLTDNAIKYGRPGGFVLIRLSRAGDAAELVVADDGKGIAPKDIPRIFDRFYRGDASRSSPGTGLGLALTERVVELHKGRIFVTSELGKGTAFRILLPLSKKK